MKEKEGEREVQREAELKLDKSDGCRVKEKAGGSQKRDREKEAEGEKRGLSRSSFISNPTCRACHL